MASPPNSYSPAISPPYPPHITIPTATKKRSIDMMPTSAPAGKRRKPSMLSATSSNHPLRQTSFPPSETDQGARYSPSPSIDNMSMASSNTKKGSQSKKKSGKRKANDDDASSLVSGRGLLSVNNGQTGGARGSKAPSRGASTAADADEDDDDDDGDAMGLALDASQENSTDTIKRRNAMIRNAMDPRQQERYDAWQHAKFSTPIVKKLINQTLSQSVPETVVFAIKVAAKLFAGEMVERARKVREQWLRVSLETQLGRPKPLLGLPSPPAEEFSSQPSASLQSNESNYGDATQHSQKQKDNNTEALEKEARLDAENRGPLLPEHLQEAFRRYKEFDGPDREMLNIWRMQRSTGAERFGLKNRKGRLFGGGRAIG